MTGYVIMDGLMYAESADMSSAGTFQFRTVVGHNNSLFDPDEMHTQLCRRLSMSTVVLDTITGKSTATT